MKINSAINKSNIMGTKSHTDNLDKEISSKSASINADKAEASMKVNVSGDAQNLQKAKSIASDTSVNEAKVARLQKLIDEGKYNVDAEAVAGKLVDEHLLLN